jgi:hypothetical protein
MDAESGGSGRLRVGPWVPEPRTRHPGRRHASTAMGIGTGESPEDPPVWLDFDDVRPRRRRRVPGRTRRRQLLVGVAVLALGVAAAVPLLRAAGHSTPRAQPPPAPVVTGPASVPVDAASASPGPSPSPSPSAQPVPPPPAPVPSRPAPRPPAPRPTGTTYEAEDPANTLGGTARVDDYPRASGGRIVRNIGNWDGRHSAGWLRFNNVTVARAGTYVLTFSFVHLDGAPTRTVDIDVSGNSPVSMTVTGSDTCCATAHLSIVLNPGANTITFSNPDDHAPSIDKIVVSSG